MVKYAAVLQERKIHPDSFLLNKLCPFLLQSTHNCYDCKVFVIVLCVNVVKTFFVSKDELIA